MWEFRKLAVTPTPERKPKLRSMQWLNFNLDIIIMEIPNVDIPPKWDGRRLKNIFWRKQCLTELADVGGLNMVHR
jgi:hypothetical protein